MQQLSDTDATTAPDLGLTMTQVLRNPLAALRAAMESFAGEFRTDDPRSPSLHAALEQVLAMSRDVEALIDWTRPRPLVPSHCTAAEILHGAVRRLVYEHAARVHLVDGARGHGLFTDSRVLADSLHLLLRGVLTSSSSDVLLRSSADEGAITFSIVQQAPDAGLERGRDAGTIERERLISLLGSELARRDVERSGGTFQIERTELGNIHIRVRMGAREVSAVA